jgi:hypothetical protein
MHLDEASSVQWMYGVLGIPDRCYTREKITNCHTVSSTGRARYGILQADYGELFLSRSMIVKNNQTSKL